jgi:hypothetical protein
VKFYVQNYNVVKEIIPRFKVRWTGFDDVWFLHFGERLGTTECDTFTFKAMYIDMKIMTDILQQQVKESNLNGSIREMRALVSDKRLIVFPRLEKSYERRFNKLMAFQYRHRIRLLHFCRFYS